MDVLEEARRRVEKGDIGEAGRLYSWVLESFEPGPERATAQFALAQLQMLRGEWDTAAADFVQFRLNYPGHRLAGLALLRISQCRERTMRIASRRTPGPAAEARRDSGRSMATTEPEKKRAGAGGSGNDPIPADAPFRGAQVLVWNATSFVELDGEMARLKAAGFNALIFRVFSNPGDRLFPFAGPVSTPVGVYYRTDRAPVVADLLGPVTKMAHRHGLKLYAWMTTRYADYGLDPELSRRWSERNYDLLTGAVLPAKGLDLFNDRVADHLAALYDDLARYPIDGLLFQDDLVSRHTEGYSDAAAGAYAREFGRPLDPPAFYRDVYRREGSDHAYVGSYTSEFWEWVRWKNRRLLDVAERLSDVVRARRPGVKVAVNFMYEAASSPRNALAWLSQSIEEADRRDFDYYAVMAYHRQMQHELGLSMDETLELLRGMSHTLYSGSRPGRAMMKLQIRDWRDASEVSAEELSRVVDAVFDGASAAGARPHVAIVPYTGAADLARLPAELNGGWLAGGKLKPKVAASR